MNTFTRILLALLCLFAALACYTFGVPAGGAAFVVLGLLLEGVFGTLLVKRRKVAGH